MAHVAVAVALSYLDFRHAERHWRQDRPRLAAWEQGFAARASMVSTRPA
jgi:glutathione S-transferase